MQLKDTMTPTQQEEVQRYSFYDAPAWLTAIAQEVAKDVNAHLDIVGLHTDPGWFLNAMGFVTVEYRTGILFHPSLKVLSDYELKGITAHELGHLSQEIYLGRDAEFAADRFAAEKGYGENLIKSFERIFSLGKHDIANSDANYPSIWERIEAIRKIQASLSLSVAA